MNPNQTTFILQDYFAAFRRRRHLLLWISAPIVLLATVFSLVLPDWYDSTSRFDIDLEGAADTLEPIELTSYADQYIAKLSDRVMRSDNLEALAQDDSAFTGVLQLASVGERIDAIRGSIDVSVTTQPVLSPLSGREVDVISGFRVTSSGPDPEFVYRVADFAAQRFLEADRLSRTERASSTSTFLREQMRSVEEEIVTLEGQIAEFKVANACCLPELIDLNTSVMQRAERDIETLQPRLRTLETERKFLTAQLDEIRQQSVSTSRLAELEREYLALVANYGPDHPDVLRVKREIGAITNAGSDANQQLGQLRLQLAEAEQRYSDEHPDVIRLKRQIATFEAEQGVSGDTGEAQLLDNPRYLQLRAQLNTIDSELSELRSRLPDLRDKIAEYEERLRRTPQIESEYQALNRKLETARSNFDSLQDRLVIARQTEALESTEIAARLSEVRPATVPVEPNGPPRAAIVIVGMFLAATFGIGSMLVSEMSDTKVRGSKDIEMTIDVVPIATIPVMEGAAGGAATRRRYLLLGVGTLIIVSAATLYMYLTGGVP